MPKAIHGRAPVGVLGMVWILVGCASAGGIAPAVDAPAPAAEAAAAEDEHPSTRKSGDRPGILVMAHGGGAEWNGRVEAALEPLRERIPVAVAFGMADPRTMQSALDDLRDRGVGTVAVVRVFVSGASFLHPTEFLLGLRPDPPERAMVGHRMVAGTELEPLDTTARILLSRQGLGGSSHAAGILVDRAASAGFAPAQSGVLLLAHGMGDDEEDRRVLASMEDAARELRGAGYAEVHVGTLREDWAGPRAEAELRIKALVAGMGEQYRNVLVIPYRVSGFGPYARILEGLEYTATDGFLPHPLMSEWIAAMATERFCETGGVSPLGPCPAASGKRIPTPHGIRR